MKILVLGGAGFLGQNLLAALTEGNWDVRVFDRPGCLPLQHIKGTIQPEWYEGDFTNTAQIEEVLQGCDIVFHLISTTLPKTSNDNPVYDIETNVIASVRMMEAAQRCGVKKIVYVSSGGTIYGIPETTPIPETHSTNPICAYGIGKLSIEKYLQLFHTNNGMDYSILRLANPYGKYQSTNSVQGVIPVFLKKILDNKPVEIWGDGSIVRDYIYADDVVTAMISSMEKTTPKKIFNIGGGHGYSINDILDAIEEVLDYKVQRIYLPGRKFDVPVNILDISAAATLLSWQPQIGLREGIEATTNYLNGTV
jgi:UDP-glucose 4-epimerase